MRCCRTSSCMYLNWYECSNRIANPSRLYPWKTDARSDVFGVVIQQSCIFVRVDSPWWAQPPVLWPCSPSCPSGHAGCWPALWLLWSASSGPISPSPACLSPLPGLSLHPHSPDQHTHKDVFNSLLHSCWGMNGLPHVRQGTFHCHIYYELFQEVLVIVEQTTAAALVLNLRL